MLQQNKDIADSDIHSGHRSRMRDKLLLHGERIFDTYELLEMLLYYSVPYKDTNPVAKRLLHRFGGLDGVFNASADALCEINGIGERTAELIGLVGRLSEVIGAEVVPVCRADYSDYMSAGKSFVEYFSGLTENHTVAVFLDNSMNLIAIEDIFKLDFASGGVKAKPFIDMAIKHRASVVITAHNHPYGPFYPSDGDRATGEMLSSALSGIGILHAEHYLICGSYYAGISAPKDFVGKLLQATKAEDFYNSKLRSVGDAMCVCDGMVVTDSGGLPKNGENNYNVRDLPYFIELLDYASNDAENTALGIINKYRTIEGAITAFYGEIEKIGGRSVACFVKLLGYLIARRNEEKLVAGRHYSEVEIADYLKAKFLGQSSEQVYLVSFDRNGAFIRADFVCEGTVNVADVLPRRILEIAVLCGAASVSIAHNHPFGTPTPSSDDVSLTATLQTALMNAEIELKNHYVVAGQLCNVIDCSGSVF